MRLSTSLREPNDNKEWTLAKGSGGGVGMLWGRCGVRDGGVPVAGGEEVQREEGGENVGVGH